MNAIIEDFKTGWYGIELGLKLKEIDDLIERLEYLKKTRSHFHYRSDFVGEKGIADISFAVMDDSFKDNMKLEI